MKLPMHPGPVTRRCALALSICAVFTASAFAAEYRFTPEPMYAPDAAREIYKPLLDYLAKSTGETFVLVAPANYGAYWRAILQPGGTDFPTTKPILPTTGSSGRTLFRSSGLPTNGYTRRQCRFRRQHHA